VLAYALVDVEKVLYGTHIRITELVRNMNIKLICSSTQKRPLKYLQSLPIVLRDKDILLFGTRGRFFDTLFFRSQRIRGARVVYDVADIPYLQNFYWGQRKIDTKLHRRFRALIGLADTLIFVSESAPSLVERSILKHKRIIIVPNASDPEFFIPRRHQAIEKTILYVGGYAPARGVDELVSAFNDLKERHRGIVLRLVGANVPPQLGSERIFVERDKIYKDMPGVFQESYMFVIPHKRNPYMDAALPVKLYDAMASGKPIVATNCSEVKKFVEHEKCGIIAEDNARSLAEAIEHLILNPKIAEEMGRRGREALLRRHSWKRRAETLLHNLAHHL
jgi:glycosyltransferase involved in cell wall biosynthesis